MAEAFRMAKGFLPVRVEDPAPVPTRLFVPDDLSPSLIILLAMDAAIPFSYYLPPLLVLDADELVLVSVLSIDDGPLILISG